MLMLGCIIQARMGSSRLPGKIMLKIDENNPILYYVIKQITSSKKLKKIIIATTDLPEDNIVAEYVQNLGLPCYRGSSDNVLERYYECAKKFSLSTIVRISADDPLVDPTIVDKVIERYEQEKCDYASNTHPRTFPQGNEVEVFSFKSLEIAWKNAKKPSEKEHVTPYIYNNKDKFQISNLKNENNLSFLRWTVDRQNDLDLVRILTSKIKKRPILMSDILTILSKEPSLVKINENHIVDEGYINSLNRD